MNILLGVTGSVAATLTSKIVKALQQLGNVKIVSTISGNYFLDIMHRDEEDSDCFIPGKDHSLSSLIYEDNDEWWKTNQNGDDFPIWTKKGDPVVHIDLRKWAGVFVVAPCSANTMAKFVHGICDNLLTSVYRAWDWTRPIIIAPAMNSLMWQNPPTAQHLHSLSCQKNTGYGEQNGAHIVSPQNKMLACNDIGIGAMAEIEDIVSNVKKAIRWKFPVKNCSGIPVGNHPGSFGFCRKHSHHTGVDLYTKDCEPVLAVETGRVIGKEPFTGPQDNSPWWNDTDCVLIEGASGIICYGEILVHSVMSPGKIVYQGEEIGLVKRVLKEGKERPDIPGHKTSMLHLELYERERNRASDSWKLDQPKHNYLVDPTDMLKNAIASPDVILQII